jgi:CHAT domain-containing protein/tetratricopeptide (TPR) repeat protein
MDLVTTDTDVLWTRLAAEASTFAEASRSPEARAALGWFHEHRSTLVGSLRAVPDERLTGALRAAQDMAPFLLAQADWSTMAPVCEAGVAVAVRLEAVLPALRLLHMLGVARQHLHDDSAEQIFATVAERADELGAPALQGQALAHLGQLQQRRGNPAAAAAQLHRAAVAYAAAGDRLGEARAVGDLATTLHDLGDSDAAASYAERSRVIFAELGDAVGEGRALRYLAGHHAGQGDLEEALRLILRAASLFDAASAVALAADAELIAAKTYRETGDLAASVRLARASVQRHPDRDAEGFLRFVEAEFAVHLLLQAPDDAAREGVLAGHPVLLADVSTHILLEEGGDAPGARWLLDRPDAAAARWFADAWEEVRGHAAALPPELPALLRELVVSTGESRGEVLARIVSVLPRGGPADVRGKYLLDLARHRTNEPSALGLAEARALAAEAAELLLESGSTEDAGAAYVLEGALWRQDRGGDLRANCDRALRALRRALSLFRRTTHPHEWAMTIQNLGNVYWQYPDDRRRNLARAAARHTAALAVLDPEQHTEERSMVLANLGLVLSEPELVHRPGNVEAANRYLTEALHGLGPTSTRALVLQNLSRLHRYRIAVDYDANAPRALQYAREAHAIDDTADAALAIADSLAQLTPTADTMAEAVSWYRRALDAVPADRMPRDHAAMADNLANTLVSAPQVSDEDTAEALALHRRSVDLYRRVGDRGEEARARFNLAGTLASRPDADLDEVVGLYEESLDGRPIGTVPLDWAQSAIALTRTLIRRGGDGDRDRAAALIQRTVGLEALAGAPVEATRAWSLSGELHADAGEWGPAARALRLALAAAESRYQVATLASSRTTQLAEIGNLPRYAAYALARAGEPETAVELLEGARARELGRLFDRDRVDLPALQAAAPESAAAYRDAVVRVAQLESEQRTGHPADPAGARRIQSALVDAQARLSAVLQSIRRLPEYAGFGQAPPDAARRAADAGVPLAYLITTGYGSVALLVGARPDGEVDAVFGSLTEQEMARSLVTADTQFGDEVLDLLGTGFLGAVAQRLIELHQDRVVLIPTGLLAIVPVHAARYARAGTSTYLLDEITVSYALSARLLLAAQSPAMTPAAPRLVAVADPASDNLQPLNWAVPESRAVARLFPGPSTSLAGAGATHAALLAALPGATHLHFACHGSYDSDEPMRSSLQLAGDDRLTLRELLDARRLDGVQLVVASACQTALSDVLRAPDEALGLPAGLAYAGVRTVIGTLWETNDMSAALLVSRFYVHHLRDHLAPAQALTAAQRWLRDATRDELVAFASSVGLPEPTRRLSNPMHWAPYVVIGAA